MNTLEVGSAQPLITEGSAGERITFGASEMIFKSPSAGSREGWTAIDYTLAAHQPGAPLHYHRELTESFFIISGELWMRVGDRELIAGPGSYFFVPPGALHGFANRSDAPVRVLAHASSPHHKTFLMEQLRLAKAEAVWPPRDLSKFIELGARYDSYYA